VTHHRYNDFSGDDRQTPKAEAREKVHIMYDFVVLDMVRQQRAGLDRAADRARLVREARPRKRRGHEAQGR
jgi:hypothetical protein